jgi:hypothetical protein
MLPVDPHIGRMTGTVSEQEAGTFTTETVRLQVEVLPHSSVARYVRVTL